MPESVWGHPLDAFPLAGERQNLQLFDPAGGSRDGLNLLANAALLSTLMSVTPTVESAKPTAQDTAALHKLGSYNPSAFLSTTVAKKILDLQFVEKYRWALMKCQGHQPDR